MLDPRPSRQIGFISTRFRGTDGVSLETAKWAEVLERLGHTCFYFAGASDRAPERSCVVAEALFTHADIQEIYTTPFSRRTRPAETTERIHQLKSYLNARICDFVRSFRVELLIVENALAIPMNIPLGLASQNSSLRRVFQHLLITTISSGNASDFS